MRFFTLSTLMAAAHFTNAYTNTSPFFFFSTSELLIPSQSSIQSAASLESSLASSLSQCPSQFYIVVSQAGVSADDFATRRAVPSLSRWMSGQDQSIKSSASIAEVVGSPDMTAVTGLLSDKCGADMEDIEVKDGSISTRKIQSTRPKVLTLNFPPPSSNAIRSEILSFNDAQLSSLISLLPSQNFTVLYLTTPLTASAKGEPQPYTFDPNPISSDQEPLHMDLKRDLSDTQHARQAAAPSNGVNYTLPSGPLFERYQYLTPGLFMGFLVALPLLLILYVAISAVSGLQVSYKAFEKDVSQAGAAGAKKQQ